MFQRLWHIRADSASASFYTQTQHVAKAEASKSHNQSDQNGSSCTSQLLAFDHFSTFVAPFLTPQMERQMDLRRTKLSWLAALAAFAARRSSRDARGVKPGRVQRPHRPRTTEIGDVKQNGWQSDGVFEAVCVGQSFQSFKWISEAKLKLNDLRLSTFFWWRVVLGCCWTWKLWQLEDTWE